MNVKNVVLHTFKVNNKDVRTIVGACYDAFFVKFEYPVNHIIQDINLVFA